MPRKPTGKHLTLRPIRLDDDVWAAIQKLKASHKTINEGLRVWLLGNTNARQVSSTGASVK